MIRTPKICLIAAMSKNHTIGLDGSLPWSLPIDWQNFKRVTDSCPFVMGRKSYESPHALYSSVLNVVLTTQSTLPNLTPNTIIAPDLPTAFAVVATYPKVFVLGGEQVFKETLPVADCLYLTIVDADIAGDTNFPSIEWADWELMSQTNYAPDPQHIYPFSINEYKKKQPLR